MTLCSLLQPNRPPVKKLHKWHGQYLMRSCDSADTTDTGIIRLSGICEFKKAATVRLWPKEACCCSSCWQQPCPEWSFVQRTLTKSPPCGLSWKALSFSSNRIKTLFENSLALPCINYFFKKTFLFWKVFIFSLSFYIQNKTNSGVYVKQNRQKGKQPPSYEGWHFLEEGMNNEWVL